MLFNDLVLVKKIKDGDIKTFEQVFKFYYPQLRLYAISMTRRADIAEEIVQDLFYILWRDRQSLHIFISLKSYLYRSVYNRSLQYKQHLYIENRYGEKLSAESLFHRGFDPQDDLEYKEFEKLIHDAFLAMPGRRLQIFQMHRFDGIKYTEIAQTLSISVKTVEAEISKALKTIRKVVENYTQIG